MNIHEIKQTHYYNYLFSSP